MKPLKNQEQLLELIPKAFSFRDLCRKCGYSHCKNTTDKIKIFCAENNISLSHFTPNALKNSQITVLTKACLHCKMPFTSPRGLKEKDYCSRSCANKSRIGIPFSDESIDRKLQTLLKNGHIKRISPISDRKKFKKTSRLLYDLTCEICQKSFENKSFQVKMCSSECLSEFCRRKAKQQELGGETNYQKNRYKDIYFDSSWEVEIAKRMDEIGIRWERNKKINFTWTDEAGETHRYYPDFYLPDFDTYLDPKNKFLLVQDDYKLKSVVKEHRINLIYGLKRDILSYIEALTPQM